MLIYKVTAFPLILKTLLCEILALKVGGWWPVFRQSSHQEERLF